MSNSDFNISDSDEIERLDEALKDLRSRKSTQTPVRRSSPGFRETPRAEPAPPALQNVELLDYFRQRDELMIRQMSGAAELAEMEARVARLEKIVKRQSALIELLLDEGHDAHG